MKTSLSRTKWLSLVITLAVLALLFGLWSRHNLAPTPQQAPLALSNGTVLSQPRLISEFTLIDMNGKPFSRDNLHGHWSFIFFGFTHCPQLCPTTLATLNEMYRQLQADKQDPLPQVIFISVDPERDSPKRIKQYVTGFNPNFFGATGTQEQLQPMTQEFSVMYAKVMQDNNDAKDSQQNYTIDHSGTLLLVDPNGQLLVIFSMPHEAQALAKSYEQVVKLYQPLYVDKTTH